MSGAYFENETNTLGAMKKFKERDQDAFSGERCFRATLSQTQRRRW
jgi:hypothetical protein